MSSLARRAFLGYTLSIDTDFMNKRGQSIIEYFMIAILVILGIVYMGPYVLRSIGAHFKLWDYSVQDSFKENLTQAPVNDVPYIPINCQCSKSTGPCGIGCNAGYHQVTDNCNATQGCANPPGAICGCDGAPTSTCVYDQSCCTNLQPSGHCGTVPCPAGGCASAPTTPQITPPSTTPNNCYIGQMIYNHECGTDTSIQCVQDFNDCPLPQCRGIVSQDPTTGITNATACPNEPPANGVPLDQDWNISYVSTSANCSSTQECQYYCNPPNVPNQSLTGCIPPSSGSTGCWSCTFTKCYVVSGQTTTCTSTVSSTTIVNAPPPPAPAPNAPVSLTCDGICTSTGPSCTIPPAECSTGISITNCQPEPCPVTCTPGTPNPSGNCNTCCASICNSAGTGYSPCSPEADGTKCGAGDSCLGASGIGPSCSGSCE